ncbi:hypothetical protein L7F22_067677 [Adiantum nelumboides]|nr:hypothetical protein [Adiantum nelumboides]
MASGKDQSNLSTFGDARGDHNEDYDNKYGPPFPTQVELRELEYHRLVGEATNMMLNFAKDPNLVKYMIETAFQDVHAQWKATTTSPPEPNTKKQHSEKELEEKVEARLAQILNVQKKGKKHAKKRRKSIDFPGYLGRQSTFDKAKKHKKGVLFAEVPSSSDSSSGDVHDSGEPDDQPEVEENEEIFVLEQILAHKDMKNKGKVQRRFLVKFKNYPALDAKWMEEEDLADTPQIVNLYLEAFGLA